MTRLIPDSIRTRSPITVSPGSTRPRMRLLLAVVAGAVVMAGCNVSAPPRARDSGAAVTIADFDPCSVLSAEEVTAAFGTPVTPRVLLGDEELSAECWFEGPLGSSEEVLLVPWSGEEPRPEEPLPPEKQLVPGVGAEAVWWASSSGYRSLNVWRERGIGFELAVVSPRTDDDNVQRAVVDLARKVVSRLDAPEPGRPTPPESTPAPFDVCQILPLPDQVDVLGWAGEPPPGMAWEFVGGAGGGSWECRRDTGTETLVIAVSKAPVAEQDLAAAGAPVRGLPRKAFFVELPARQRDPAPAGAALSTTAADGRLLKLVLFDTTNVATRRASLVSLTRVVLAGLS